MVISNFRGCHGCFDSYALTISRQNVKSEAIEVAGGYIVETVKSGSARECSSSFAGDTKDDTKGSQTGQRIVAMWCHVVALVSAYVDGPRR